ncbi:LysR family transcriptional regulator [Rhodopseudomonas boonkerdii]|uniref:LysR family transcriptional regulator n=1 Tax=Rhodopseudomonas boonkerdii TaxID=475937 RepID=UPI001E5E17DB|nr:LysR family transcriptional regulator [Rhodopseudomonas boonkerdii]UGV28416.1 LysR family transcriptional regulator [Rhodopseudomonas boonkerdii]
MHRRHHNIPIEIVRTVVAISEAGSLTKAADQMGLSQPAVSSQIKRLEQLVGGSLFSKTPNGSCPTDLGKLVLAQARKIIEANDQVLALGGADSNAGRLRLGLSSLLSRQFVEHHIDRLGDIQILAAASHEISSALVEGHIDIACFYQRGDIEPDLATLIVDEYEDHLVWVRSKNFVLSPGAPIPIVTSTNDDWMISTLTRHGLSYRIAFSSQDYDAKKSAVEAGIGLIAMPSRMIPSGLVWAKEYYLPELSAIKNLLCIRQGLSSNRVLELKNQLSQLFMYHSASRETHKVA